MKTNTPFILCAHLFTLLTLTSCNGGVNLTVPGAPVAEGSEVVVDPNSTPAPEPAPTVKNRIFVTNALVRAINSPSVSFYDYVCNREAKKAKVKGKFAALIATSNAEFAETHAVNGSIYQKFLGVESLVASSFQDLIAGKNDSIYTTANQLPINSRVKNYVWTGQKDFNQAASTDENCNDWSTNKGNAIVGLAGTTGSDAMAIREQSCNIFAHLYCIEVQ